ncbi:MAG: prevent-host-death protein [Caulobacter sp.]|nr:prevent-host-death protein [Caulobacter sp.]
MTRVNLAEAKTHLSALVERAEKGEPQTPRKPIDIEALKAMTDKMTPQTESAGDFVRRMRDDYRY